MITDDTIMHSKHYLFNNKAAIAYEMTYKAKNLCFR